MKREEWLKIQKQAQSSTPPDSDAEQRNLIIILLTELLEQIYILRTE